MDRARLRCCGRGSAGAGRQVDLGERSRPASAGLAEGRTPVRGDRREGNVYAYTGPKATQWAGNKACSAPNTTAPRKETFSPARRCVDSMVARFERTPGHLAYRLVAALEGGQSAGGDKRGMESAALVIVKKDGGVWLHNDTVLRLQVDDSPEPIKETAPAGGEAAAHRGRFPTRP